MDYLMRLLDDHNDLLMEKGLWWGVLRWNCFVVVGVSFRERGVVRQGSPSAFWRRMSHTAAIEQQRKIFMDIWKAT